AFRNFAKLERHPCIVGIWTVLDNVVGESIAAERNARIEDNGGGRAVFQLV
ncbi:hypothetical protein X777_07862, partial [Ooceraea biroi]